MPTYYFIINFWILPWQYGLKYGKGIENFLVVEAQKRKNRNLLRFSLVPTTGFEPARPYEHHPLKMACLPISPRGRLKFWFANIIVLNKSVQCKPCFSGYLYSIKN